MKLTRSVRAASLAGAAITALLTGAGHAAAADAAATTAESATGSEGADVSAVVVMVERDLAAAAAPSKASLLETQPESIITHAFIEQATPESGDYTTTILMAPSIGGISAAGGGIGDTNKATLRGFQDGQYNLTYDGLAIGDTNDPTHHPADYFPASTIGTAVVDRGPGAAGDLGQANLGGAIHLFSPTVSDTFGASQKATFGSFNTQDYVTELQSGQISQIGGAKILVDLDERSSDTEMSNSPGVAQTQMIKVVQPIGSNTTLTGFSAHSYSRFYASDAALPPGETAAQIAAYGKDFALTNNPADEHYYGYNHEKKQTDFEYLDLKSKISDKLDVEDQAYTYFYSNKTISANDVSGLVGVNTSAVSANGVAYGAANGLNINKGDIQGYDKLNRYRVVGDILRVNYDLGFGTLRSGALLEDSWTSRHKFILDLTTGGVPDYKFKPTAYVPYQTNIKLLEDSSWNQYQLFTDFEWRATDALTITPGFKYVNFTRKVSAPLENGVEGNGPSNASGPIHGQNTYDANLYFLTANYRLTSYWSIYAQSASGFLIPSLSYEQVANFSLNNLKPQESVSYQTGTVYTKGAITFDADVYKVDVKDAEIAGPALCQCYVNGGSEEFSGVEGEGAYTLGGGLTLFSNGSLNSAKLASGGVVQNAPKWTNALGGIYTAGKIAGTLTWKTVGDQISSDGTHLGAYKTIDGTVSYDFGHFKAKLAVFNLTNDRAVTQLSGGFYAFQVGRQVQFTLQAKF